MFNGVVRSGSDFGLMMTFATSSVYRSRREPAENRPPMRESGSRTDPVK